MGSQWTEPDDWDDSMLNNPEHRPGEGRIAGCVMAILTFGILVAVIVLASWGCSGPH